MRYGTVTRLPQGGFCLAGLQHWNCCLLQQYDGAQDQCRGCSWFVRCDPMVEQSARNCLAWTNETTTEGA